MRGIKFSHQLGLAASARNVCWFCNHRLCLEGLFWKPSHQEGGASFHYLSEEDLYHFLVPSNFERKYCSAWERAPKKAHCLGLLFETWAYAEAERKHKVGQWCTVFMADTDMVEIPGWQDTWSFCQMTRPDFSFWVNGIKLIEIKTGDHCFSEVLLSKWYFAHFYWKYFTSWVSPSSFISKTRRGICQFCSQSALRGVYLKAWYSGDAES